MILKEIFLQLQTLPNILILCVSLFFADLILRSYKITKSKGPSIVYFLFISHFHGNSQHKRCFLSIFEVTMHPQRPKPVIKNIKNISKSRFTCMHAIFSQQGFFQ